MVIFIESAAGCNCTALSPSFVIVAVTTQSLPRLAVTGDCETSRRSLLIVPGDCTVTAPSPKSLVLSVTVCPA